jgi:hypothetical protein
MLAKFSIFFPGLGGVFYRQPWALPCNASALTGVYTLRFSFRKPSALKVDAASRRVLFHPVHIRLMQNGDMSGPPLIFTILEPAFV